MNLERYLHYLVFGSPPKKRRAPRRPRRGPVRDWRYRRWIRSLPSVVSGLVPCEAAHTGSDGGMAQKASDTTCVPLTPEEHREYHRIGRRAFEIRYRIEFSKVVRDLNQQYYVEKLELEEIA